MLLLNIANVITTTGDVWSGVASAGVSDKWLAEAAETTPTLAFSSIPAYEMSWFRPYSVDLEGDAALLLAELSKALLDAAE